MTWVVPFSRLDPVPFSFVPTLGDLHDALEGQTAAAYTASELVELLRALPETAWGTLNSGGPITPHRFAKLLRPFDIRSRQEKVNGINRRRYDRKDFGDAFQRYLLNGGSESDTSATFIAPQGFTPLSQAATRSLCSGSKDTANLDKMGEVSTVALPSRGERIGQLGLEGAVERRRVLAEVCPELKTPPTANVADGFDVASPTFIDDVMVWSAEVRKHQAGVSNGRRSRLRATEATLDDLTLWKAVDAVS